MSSTHKYDFKAGEKDSFGDEIRTVYAKEVGKYIIYETKDKRVRVDGEKVSMANHGKVNKLVMQNTGLTLNSPTLKNIYNSHLGYALEVLFRGDEDTCCEILQRDYHDMKRRLQRHAVLAYQSGAAALTLTSLVTCLLIYKYGSLNQLWVRVICALAFSSIGGFLSVAIGSNKLAVDLQSIFSVNMVYGALRIVIALISGIMVYFLIEAKLLLTVLKDAADLYGFIVTSFASGFSETLVPNIMKKIEKE